MARTKMVDGVSVPLTPEEEAERDADEINAAQQKSDLIPTQYSRDREAAYLAEGFTPEALAVALWERDIEGRPDAADAMEVIRQEIKTRIPKPGR